MTKLQQNDGYRSLRGGCWFLDAALCRAADRRRVEPGWRFSDFGFRPVAEVKKKGKKR